MLTEPSSQPASNHRKSHPAGAGAPVKARPWRTESAEVGGSQRVGTGNPADDGDATRERIAEEAQHRVLEAEVGTRDRFWSLGRQVELSIRGGVGDAVRALAFRTNEVPAVLGRGRLDEDRGGARDGNVVVAIGASGRIGSLMPPPRYGVRVARSAIPELGPTLGDASE